MWQLSMRGENRTWTELGSFESIGLAAQLVLKLERNPTEPVAALFFRVYADPLMDKSDAEILSRLEYQGANGFYVLKRQVQ
ncbi:MAG: SPOR domain-containing protein [Acetobacteraceae bacterium]